MPNDLFRKAAELLASSAVECSDGMLDENLQADYRSMSDVVGYVQCPGMEVEL